MLLITKGALAAAVCHPEVLGVLQSRRSGAWLDKLADAIFAALEGAEAPDLLTPAEVARVFRVDPKTITRWAADGRIASVRTPGGHRRFRRDEVLKLYLQEES